ncbi:MAG: hypothetical protein ACPHXR_04355 [Flavicella sp.]
MRKALLIFIAAVFLFSCKSAKYRKIANEFEKNGAFEQAANYYYKSLLKKPDNVTSIIGYKKNSQIVLDQLFSKFENSFKSKDYKSAVYLYGTAQKKISQASSFSITLHEPQNAALYYNESKDIYLNQLYYNGVQENQAQNYSNAKVIFNEILSFDPQFKDSNKQLTVAECEPLYLDGINLLEQNANRKAYYKFEEILRKASYKDTYELKKESLDKAMIKIAVGINPSKSSNRRYDSKYRNYLLSKLQAISSPFYSYIGFTPKPYSSLNSQLIAAKSKGAKALVVMDIDYMSNYTSRLKTKQGKAYKSSKEKYKDEAGKTKERTIYIKETYKIYNQSKSVSSQVSFNLYSTITGENIVQHNAKERAEDAVNYAYYNGNSKVLIPGYWKYFSKKHESDKVYASSYSAKRNLRNLFSSRKQLKTTSDLFFTTLNKIGYDINLKIINYDAE